jgi:hypothetical protein
MVSITPGQAFLNIGKSAKTERVSKYCGKSRGTEHNTTTVDRQSYYEDCLSGTMCHAESRTLLVKAA